MASIGPITSSTATSGPSGTSPAGSASAPQQPGPTGNAATLAALSQAFATGSLYGGPLGLGRPNTPEDAAAILAAAELALDQTAAETRAQRIENTYGGGRAALGAFAGAIGAVQLGVALDNADLAADARTEASLTATQALQALNIETLGQGKDAADSAAATLAASAPAAGKSLDTAGYVGLLTTARASLQSEIQAISATVNAAKQQALADQTASLTRQIADVDAGIAKARASGADAAVEKLQATRAALAGDLSGLPASLDAAYGAVLADGTAALVAAANGLSAAITTATAAAGSNPPKSYTAGDVAAAAGSISAAASGVPARIAAVTGDSGTTAAAIKTTGDDQTRLLADIAAQFGSLQQQALTIMPVFSRIAVDAFGVGDHRTDAVRSSELTRGFEALEEAAQAFRDAQAARDAQDAQQKSRQDQDRDGKRVSDLAAGLVAGLSDLRAVLKQEAAASSSGGPSDAAMGRNDRLRFSL